MATATNKKRVRGSKTFAKTVTVRPATATQLLKTLRLSKREKDIVRGLVAATTPGRAKAG